jgi:hypothetical protein
MGEYERTGPVKNPTYRVPHARLHCATDLNRVRAQMMLMLLASLMQLEGGAAHGPTAGCGGGPAPCDGPANTHASTSTLGGVARGIGPRRSTSSAGADHQGRG